MKKEKTFNHEFVEHIPKKLEEDKIYISISFSIAIHKCACGCGNEVVTPLSSTDWSLIYDGETISLNPSIGNWGFACESHYWIENNKIKWAYKWSQKEIRKGRVYDNIRKTKHYKDVASKNIWNHLTGWLDI